MTSLINNMHKPVLINEAINYLPNKENLSVIDATFGGGSYSKIIFESDNVINLIAIDRDPLATKFSKKIKKTKNKNFKLCRGNFSEIDYLVKDFMKENKLSGFDAIFFDLGISSNQINNSDRGFSFKFNGPLDMRMDNMGLSASDLLNTYEEKEIANIIFKYGEEKFARRIAKNIIKFREKKEIETTYELVDIIKKSIKIPKKIKLKKNIATKTFQALRIYVNNELEEISIALKKSEKLLLPGGRIIIVSFHSLEDKLVKDFLYHNSGKSWRSSRHYPELSDTGPKTLKIITKKAIRPLESEITTNPRSRSAKLRVAEKIIKHKETERNEN